MLFIVQHEFHPQLTGLVLHDEKHFIVIGRQGPLSIQDGVKLQVVAVAHGLAEIQLSFFVLHYV
jgi:hypothetical protein